jgi:hypothetical protein
MDGLALLLKLAVRVRMRLLQLRGWRCFGGLVDAGGWRLSRLIRNLEYWFFRFNIEGRLLFLTIRIVLDLNLFDEICEGMAEDWFELRLLLFPVGPFANHVAFVGLPIMIATLIPLHFVVFGREIALLGVCL